MTSGRALARSRSSTLAPDSEPGVEKARWVRVVAIIGRPFGRCLLVALRGRLR